jgi:hypothetical protein
LITDISERKRAEQEVRRSGFSDAVLNSLPGIFSMSPLKAVVEPAGETIWDTR